MRHAVRSKQGERGATLILVTFVATFVLIPIVGLAIDGALLFWMNARLSASVDAAALAAGRSLNLGPDEAAQEANARLVAQQYFSANFPTGLMRSSIVGGAPTVVFTIPSPHLRTIQVTASAVIPLFFMPILRVNTGTVAATGTASRRDANIILVLDRSSSMGSACSALISSAKGFVARFANGRDRLGLVTFSTTANIDFQPTLTFNTSSPNLSAKLDTLNCAGFTNTAEGLYTAYKLITDVINQPGALNVILLFTDGSPSAITAAFPVKQLADTAKTRYGSSSSTYTQLMAVVKSTCTSTAAMTGVMTDSPYDSAPSIAELDTTGYTLGLFEPAGLPLTSNALFPDTLSLSGCGFSSDPTTAREDVAYIPDTDRNTNSTTGGVPGIPAPDRFTSGPYVGSIRPDVPRTMRYVAFSDTDAMARTIHNNTTYTPVIYTIGLTGNEAMPMNENFMERLANDPGADNFDPTKPQGQFISANDAAGVAAAFNQIASQVLRLSK